MKRTIEMVDIIIRRVVLYLRLSKEDIDKLSEEEISKSIKNQETMLREEVAKHPDWEIVGVYCDEDYSGAGTYRPDFEKMIKSCENGEVDIVLCKSQSRFSRDMEVIEKYLHNKFIEWGVRFVSIVDNADTENKGNKKARQINALVNEWFLEELSDNIKGTFRAKWENGESTASFAKYGFIKDPKNKNHFLIDPIAKQVKITIAELFLQGNGQDRISNILEEKNIPCPYEYKLMNGCKLKLPVSKNFDPTIIKKAGKHIVKFSLYNNYREILKNVNSLYVIGTDENKNHSTNLKLRVRSISEDIKIYYTTSDLGKFEDIDLSKIDFNKKIWKELKVNEKIPNDIKYIGSLIVELDRLNTSGFELEVELEDNKSHGIYKPYLVTKSNNTTKELEFKYEIRKKYRWTGRTVYEILKDPFNNGTLIQGKTRRISYKNHKVISADKSQWIIYENAVEKTYDDEMWLAIQEKLKEVGKVSANGKRHIFSGKVFCKECGSTARKDCSGGNTGEKVYYLKCGDKENNWANCDNCHAIRFNDVENYVKESINNLLATYFDENILNDLHKDVVDKDMFKEQINTLLKEKEDLQKLINNKKVTLSKLYEDRTNGILDEEDYIFLYNKFKDDKNKYNERLDTIEDELKLIEIKQNKMKDKKTLFSKYKHIEELSQELIDEFINKITIGKKEDSKNAYERINIEWNFQL